MKHMAKKGKIAVKKWVLGGQKQVFGLKKIRGGNQNRKAKWCKMQALLLKTDKTRGVRN